MEKYYHSVVLDEDKCKGCTTCIRNCPTQAIRVRNGKAVIIQEKCIDCGECIRVCPHNAKSAITDPVDIIKKYSYTVALPAPTVIGQFDGSYSTNEVLNAIKNIGFNEVIEVAYGAEVVGEALKWEVEKEKYRDKRPIISSACPAVIRLIQVRFPELIDNIVQLESPMEVTARITKERLCKEKGLKKEEIGLFFITPCAAKSTIIQSSTPWEENGSIVEGAISIKDIYPQVSNNLKNLSNIKQLQIASGKGMVWAGSGGEGANLSHRNFIHVDGIQNIIGILEEMEMDKLKDIEYLEALACIGGCVGGCLTVENPFIARKHIDDRKDENKERTLEEDRIKHYYEAGLINRKGNILPRPSPPLDEDITKAIQKMTRIDNIEKTLPSLDCGSCGAPGCRALAEDIVRGVASEVDCIFVLREAIGELSKLMLDLSGKLVPVMDNKGHNRNE